MYDLQKKAGYTPETAEATEDTLMGLEVIRKKHNITLSDMLNENRTRKRP